VCAKVNGKDFYCDAKLYNYYFSLSDIRLFQMYMDMQMKKTGLSVRCLFMIVINKNVYCLLNYSNL